MSKITETPYVGEVEITLKEDEQIISNVKAHNYIHARVTASSLQRYRDESLSTMLGAITSSDSLYDSGRNLSGQVGSFVPKMNTLVLALGSPIENNPIDDSLMEADKITSFTYLTNPSMSSDTLAPAGGVTSETKRTKGGGITIQLEFSAPYQIEFDTIYLTGRENVVDSSSLVTDLEVKHKSYEVEGDSFYAALPSNVEYLGILTEGSNSILGRSMVFGEGYMISGKYVAVVLGLENAGSDTEKIMVGIFNLGGKKSYDTEYRSASFREIIKIPTSPFRAQYGMGYSVDVVDEYELDLCVLSGVASHSKVSPLDYGITHKQFRGRNVVAYFLRRNSEGSYYEYSRTTLKKTSQMTGNFGDMRVVGDYIYVLAEAHPVGVDAFGGSVNTEGGRVSKSTSQNTNEKITDIILCRYHKSSGNLVGHTTVYANSSSTKLTSSSGFPYGELSLYKLYYDGVKKRMMIYQSSYANAGTSYMTQVDLNTLQVSSSRLKLLADRMSYRKEDNRNYKVIRSALSPTKLAIIPVHVAPISTKCKLSTKVVKRDGQSMTLTYRIAAGNPVE